MLTCSRQLEALPTGHGLLYITAPTGNVNSVQAFPNASTITQTPPTTTVTFTKPGTTGVSFLCLLELIL